jgi:hypothetical protein
MVEVVGEVGRAIAHFARRLRRRGRGLRQQKTHDESRGGWPARHHGHMIAVPQGVKRTPGGSTEDRMPRGPRKTNDDVLLKSAELIGWALGGLEREIVATKNRLATLTAQASKLRKRVGTRVAAAAEAAGAATAPVRKRRKMSRAARKRISEMMKKRWAEKKK